MKRIDQLTFTRFLAILLVLIYHDGGRFYFGWLNFPPLSYLLYSAPTGVSYLYVLSGFVMSIVYHRPGEKFDVRGYWTARIVRIYPLYIISFLLVCYFYLDYMARIKPQKILVNLFVLQAWWPPYAQSFNYTSWSMTVEFFFYAILPFFTMWAYRQSTRKLIWVSLILWAVSQIVHFTLWTGFYPDWQFFIVYNPVFHLNSFIMGVVGGIWFLRDNQNNKTNPKINLILVLGSLVLIGGYIILSNIYAQLPHNLQPMSGLLSPFLILFIVTLSLDKTKLSTFLDHRWLVILGETAYAVYILSAPVYWIYERALFSSSLKNPEYILSATYLPVMIFVGLISYFYIDPPLRRWMKKILARVTMPLLMLDLAILAASVYIAFRLRFGDGREFLSYRSTALIMFWIAFILRTAVSIALNSLNPAILGSATWRMIRPTVLSTTLGSIMIMVLVYTAYKAGWVENFPRSVFLIDWAVVLTLSVAARFLFRSFPIYKNEVRNLPQ